MNVRTARISDVKAIHSLINFYAEQDKMLFRSVADIYKNLQAFTVAEQAGDVVGCCALEIVWSFTTTSVSIADLDHDCDVDFDDLAVFASQWQIGVE